MERVSTLPYPRPIAVLLIFLLLITATTNASSSFPFFRSYSQYKTFLSLSHSLLIRVSNLRASRGDSSGADSARLIAQKVENFSGLGIWRVGLSVGWDYAKNYAWKDWDYSELHGVVSELNELAGLMGELTRAESEVERGSWIARNYSNIFRIAKSVLRRFLKIFGQSGALKEVAEAVQREVLDGGLLRDCLELGSNDLKGLIQIIKDLASQYSSTDGYNSEL